MFHIHTCIENASAIFTVLYHLKQKAGWGGAHLSSHYVGGVNRRIAMQASLGRYMGPYLKNN
jgi:hypothetical protein